MQGLSAGRDKDKEALERAISTQWRRNEIDVVISIETRHFYERRRPTVIKRGAKFGLY